MTVEPIWRRLVVALLTLVLAPLSVLVVAGPAYADADASITGTVTGGGAPLTNGTVTVYTADWVYVTAAGINGGSYTVSGLPAGDYLVEFRDDTDDHFSEYYDDAATHEQGTTIGLDAGEAFQADADLTRSGAISGTVTAPGGDAEAVAAVLERWVEGSWAWERTLYVGSDGSYRQPGLRAGDYRVSFSDSSQVHLEEWYDDSPTAEGAQTLEVRLGEEIEDVDATLTVGGRVTGTVTDGTDPLYDVRVRLSKWDDATGEWGPENRTTTTDHDGHYALTGLPPGDYTVRFEDSSGTAGGYLQEFYDDATSRSSATPITITAGGTVEDVDAALTAGGRITGTIEDELTGDPVARDVFVYRVDSSGERTYVRGVVSGADGTFEVSGLETGDYLLLFGPSPSYASEWWQDQPTAETATPIAMTAGTTYALPEAVQLAPTGSVSGTVTDGTDPVAGVTVRALTFRDGAWRFHDETTTGPAGGYELVGLPAATYRLHAVDPAGGYIETYWPGVPDVEEATDVEVTSGQNTPGRDFALTSGAELSGTVTGDDDGDGTGDQGLRTWVHLDRYVDPDGSGEDPGTWQSVTTVVSDYDGTWRIGGLAGGRYRLFFLSDAGSYFLEYWDDAPDADAATPIDLVPGQSFTADATLLRTAGISGTVTGPDGPVEGVEVNVYTRDSEDELQFRTRGTTGADGTYAVDGIEADTYYVEFDGTPAGHLDEYYDDTTDPAEATPVVVGTAARVTDIDATLTRGGTVAGTVTNAAAEPLEGIRVQLLRAVGDDWEYQGHTETEPDGTYAFRGLPDGAYRATFVDYDGDYVQLWFDNVEDPHAATSIVVEDGVGRDDVDATMLTYGGISGRVTDGLLTLPGITLDLYRYEPDGDYWWYVGTEVTDSDGAYSFTDLRTGAYTLRFTDAGGTWFTEWWQDAADQEGATSIDIRAGQIAELDDATLDQAARLAGVVTGDGGLPLEGVTVSVHRDIEHDWPLVGSVTTDENGAFDIGDLADGEYVVRLDGRAVGYLPEWWEDAEGPQDATPVSVSVGSPGTITPVLARSGTISGVVDAGGVPVSDVDITLHRWVEDGEYWGHADYRQSPADGTFAFTGLAPGTYTVEFDGRDGGYLREFWDSQASLEDADGIELDFGEEVAADAHLVTGGTITGTVTDEVTHDPIDHALVSVYSQSGESWMWRGDTWTDATGAYTLGGLPSGDYRVGFDTGSRPYPHLYEAWPDAPTVDEGESFTVTVGGAAVVKDAALTPGAHLSGTLVAEDSDPAVPIEGVVVEIYRGDDLVSDTVTDADGGFDLVGLRAGGYQLRFGARGSGYLDEWWRDAATRQEATPVVLTTGESVSLADAVELTEGGRIGGTITGPDVVALDSARVRLHRVDGAAWEYDETAYTDSDGNYDFRGLPDGTYGVEVRWDGSNPLLTEYYDGARTRDEAELLEVVDGTVHEGIDVGLAEPATITGTVTDLEGNPQVEEDVVLYMDDGDGGLANLGDIWSGNDGGFTFDGLWPGTYYVRATGWPVLSEWWEDGVSVDEATPIELASGEVATLNFELAAGAHITGSVTDPEGEAVADVEVTAFRLNTATDDWEDTGSAWTDDDGSYDIGGLPHGTYRLRFDSDDFDTEFWDDAATLDSATSIELADEETVAERDAGLTRAIGNHDLPVVTGDALVGSELEADPGEWDVATPTLAYQWLRDGDAIDGAEEPTYTLTADDRGEPISVEVTASKDGYRDGVAVSDETDEVDLPTLSVTAAPTVSGDAIVGSRLTASPGTWSPDDGLTYAYQWLRDGDPIPGADDATYDVTLADLGEPISVEVTASRDGYHDETATSDPTDDVVLPTLANTAPPTVTGTPKVGSVLTASPGIWSASGAAFGYQWLAGNEPIAGASGTTYTPTIGDIGKGIRVRVTASRTDWTGASATSDATGAVQPADFTVSAPPAISGTPRVGVPLSASAGTWAPAPDALTFQWRSGGAPIAGATGTTYTPVAGDAGRQLDVLVTAAKAGYTPASATTAPVTVAAGTIAATVKPTLTGKVKRGAKLLVKPGTWSPAGATVIYQWYAGKQKVAKATKAALKLTGRTLKAVASKAISVRITVSAPGYVSTTVTLKAKGRIKPSPVRLAR